MRRISRSMLLALATVMAVTAGCAADNRSQDDDAIGRHDPQDFFADPASFVGEEVAVAVVVDEVLGVDAFQAVTPDPSGQGLLILHPGVDSPPVGLQVEVSGTVEEFNPATLKDRYDLTIPDDVFTPYEGEYGIVASEVVPHLAAAGSSRSSDVREAVAFFTDPAALRGETVRVDVIVDEVISDELFRIVAEDASGEGILAAHDGSVSVAEGSFISIRGVVKPFGRATVIQELGVVVPRRVGRRFHGDLSIIAAEINPIVP